MTVGENIKRARKEKGITQKELGIRLGGISQQQIGQWETGKARPKIETILKIAEALGVEIYDIDERIKEIQNNNIFIDYLERAIALNEESDLDDTLMQENYRGMLCSTEQKNENIKQEYTAKEYDLITNGQVQQLLKPFYELNYTGKQKAVEAVEMLAKIPEYQKDNKSESED